MHQQIALPDTLALWPWQSRRQNPFYDEVSEQSAAWFANFGTLGQKAQRIFATNKFGLLAGLAYPDLDKERFRTSCDLMNIFSSSTTSPTWRLHPRAHDEWVGGEIARQFWILARKSVTLSSQERFIEAFDGWLQGLAAQAEDRDKPRLRDINSYFALRRVTVGLKPSLMIFEFGMELPREVLQHPTIEKLSLLCTDLILIDNDMASYNKEQACGDDKHNIVAIAMDQLHLDVQGAMNWAADYHAATVDLDIETYVDGMGNWVRANVQWSFESERYFGNKSGRVMTTRRMSLLPRTRPEDVGLSEICAVKG
ncbi:delta(6)-protoilludene synthase [Hirsutella rhossiliensis]|uniref:Terpene synthase n=1 Tax=Hirsutella rhossiliensis TaxID=111463 RepID=A0A9P8SHY7_9HYPO|nr:delta(6)-protoilludene synthase [Hirsutella rhossiliensis]KAH0962060.1 delta(6)-protoilludene synthase [Hirsutella rhossiliensis]